MTKEEVFEIVKGKGILSLDNDFVIKKVVGITYNIERLQDIKSLHDEDSILEFKMELIRKFQERIENLF